jgi:hypothetical protein
MEKLASFPAVAPSQVSATLRAKAGFTMDLLAAELLSVTGPQPRQLAAIRVLATFTHADVARTLREPWSAYSPVAREEVLTALFARRDRVGALLAAIENQIVNQGQVSAARRTQMLANPDRAIKARAAKIFGQQVAGTRTEVVAGYRAALGLAGRAGRGARLRYPRCRLSSLGRTRHRNRAEPRIHPCLGP